VDRPKQGFGVPVHEWLRGPLRPWAEELMNESRLREQGYFSPAPIQRKWTEHVKGRHNWHAHLWGVLMFQAWLEQHKSFVSAKTETLWDASVMSASSHATEGSTTQGSAL
jgi:asparagine synthase (glutamine-hydrolysing)